MTFQEQYHWFQLPTGLQVCLNDAIKWSYPLILYCKPKYHQLHYRQKENAINQLPYRKKKSRQKMPVMNFFADYFFYRRIFEYSYWNYFYKEEHLVFSNLKITLIYLFDFKFD